MSLFTRRKKDEEIPRLDSFVLGNKVMINNRLFIFATQLRRRSGDWTVGPSTIILEEVEE